eukprot:TRINITY_DN12810_c0_g1_i1.p1 TRINITY_DN12810_c0_g1~~TRINITY_DN12810_c0_g1_i1.p1  ORF type:complete len:616 (+),score=193.86 TRINITY_DN12810_c0_g1_i1:208-2055(+)
MLATAQVAAGGDGLAAQRERERKQQLSRERMQNIRMLFDKIDLDGNGFVTMVELRVLWKIMFPELTSEILNREVERVFKRIDVNHNNKVSWEEMVSYLDPANGEGESDEADVYDLLCDDDEESIPVQPETARGWLWALMDYSSASEFSHLCLRKSSLLVQMCMMSAILASVALMMVESLPEVVDCDPVGCRMVCACAEPGPDCIPRCSSDCSCKAGTTGTAIAEAACIAVFTLEFTLRLCSTPSQAAYWTSGWTWIDIVSVLPFYLTVLGLLPSESGAETLVVLRVLRIARLARVLRVARISKNFKSIQIMIIALMRARIALVLMCALMLITIVFFSTLMYFVEKRDTEFDPIPTVAHPNGKWVRTSPEFQDHGKPVFFQSIPATMWWGLATVTTVGYGDQYPVTPEGKFIASLTMVTGILVVSYPITILTNAFATVSEEFREDEQRKRRKEEFKVRLAGAAQNPDGQFGHPMGGWPMNRQPTARPSMTRSGRQQSPRDSNGQAPGRFMQRMPLPLPEQDEGHCEGDVVAPAGDCNLRVTLEAQIYQQGELMRRMGVLEQQQQAFQAEVLRRLDRLCSCQCGARVADTRGGPASPTPETCALMSADSPITEPTIS